MSKIEAKSIKTVRLSITLRENVYEEIKKLSYALGIKPSSWITMILTSKVNGFEMLLKKPAQDDKAEGRKNET